jgi:hypothetical protein
VSNRRTRRSLPDNSVPAQFNVHLAVEIIYEITLLPDQAIQLTALATALFRQVSGLSDNSDVTICYQENEE